MSLSWCVATVAYSYFGRFRLRFIYEILSRTTVLIMHEHFPIIGAVRTVRFKCLLTELKQRLGSALTLPTKPHVNCLAASDF